MVEDRDRIVGLVGHKVAVRLTGVEIIATLDEVRDDGVVLSEIGELGPGPTLFCPWDSLKRVRDRLPWLIPPHEEPGPEEVPQEQGFYELREATAEEVAPEPPVEHRRASARNLDPVVPIGQRRTVGEVTVALTSLELFGEGVGVLRYRISYDGACSTASSSRSSSSGTHRAAPCPGHRRVVAAARAKRMARWRSATCRSPGNWRSR